MVSKKTVILSLLSLIVAVFLGFLAFQGLTKYPKGTQVAGVLVEGMSKKDASALLHEKINIWKTEEFLFAQSEHEEVAIPRSIFHFDIDTTLNQLQARTKGWIPLVKKSNVVQPLVVEVEKNNTELTNLPTYVDIHSTLTRASTIASNLDDHIVEIEYAVDRNQQLAIVAETSITIPSELSNPTLNNLISQLNGWSIKSEEIFSVSEALSPITDTELPEINLIASGLYSVVLQSNLTVLERYSQGSIPVYAEPGIEVSINPKVDKDFIFYNPNVDSYTLGLVLDANQLHIKLESFVPEDALSYHVKNVSEVQPRTVYRYSKGLSPGTSRTIQEGVSGLEVEVYRTEQGEEKLVSRDFYPPEPKIVLLPISSGMLTENGTSIGSLEGENDISDFDNFLQNENPGTNEGNELDLGNVSEGNQEGSLDFYNFVSAYCAGMEAEKGELNSYYVEAENEEIRSCIESLDNNQLQLLRLMWASNNPPDTNEGIKNEDNQNQDSEEEEQIYVK